MKYSSTTPYPNIDNCWKRIGVWGSEKPRCPVLEEVIHCRNCEVFSSAGRSLLERDLSIDYRHEWTGIMASEKEEELVGAVSVVIFRIEDEWLGLSTKVLSEIIDPTHLQSHTVPHRKNPVLKGLVNIRGEIQLHVSLKELLGIEKSKKEKKNRNVYRRMIVLESDSGHWVFSIDEILGIYRVHPRTFKNVPVTVAKSKSTYTKGIFKWDDKYVALLDDDLLIFSLTRSVQ